MGGERISRLACDLSAVNFLTILDFGMQPYFVNSLIAAWARQDLVRYHRIVAVAMTLYSSVLLMAALGLVVITFAISWADLLGLHTITETKTLWTAGLLAAGVLVLIPEGIFTGIYRARGEYNLSVAASIITQTLSGYGFCFVAAVGGPPPLAASLYISAAGTTWLLIGIDQWRRYHDFPLAVTIPRLSELRSAFPQCAQYWIAGLSQPIVLNVPIILLGMWGAPRDRGSLFRRPDADRNY